MKLQIVKLNTPSKILKGWAEVKEIEGKKVWVFAHDQFEADDSVDVGMFAHVLSSKNDVTKIQIRHIVKVPSDKFKKGQWYNAFKENGVWKINNKYEVEFPAMFEKFNKVKVVAQEVNETESLLEIISFVDMKRKSGYSILDSTISISAMIQHTEFSGALTDKNLLSGLISYYKGMKDQKKHPILGVTLNVPSIDGTYDGKELTFLAKSSTGFKNAGLMSTYAAHNLVKEIPYLSDDDMKEYRKDVVCLIPQETSELTDLLMQNDEELAEAYIKKLKAIFDTRLYIAVSKHDEESNEMATLRLQKFAKKHKVQVVIGSDSHMINRGDEDNHDVLRCIGLGTTTDDQTRPRYDGDFYHLLGQEEALEVYGEELMWNTLNLAESLDVKIQFGVNYLPKFPIPEGFTSESYFKHLAYEGYKFRFGGTEKDTEEYRERLDFEIETILKMDFPDYFLIVADFMRFARDNDIETGPGRGSACGSMVAYVLQITDVDPIEYGLLFERFLNPDRVSMPDIDLDFDDTRREEVIDYVKGLYGVKSVSRIITFGTLSARSVVRDVTRVLNYSYSLGDKISKSIPGTPGMTLEVALIESPDLKDMYVTNPTVKEIIDTSMALEGLPRNTGVHACGVLIAPGIVEDYLPQVQVFDDEKEVWEDTTQVTMAECEALGLLKMDFLGLRTMGVSSAALDLINGKRNEKNEEPIKFKDIPLTDVKVYEFISKGETEGVFQLESPGMTVFMKDLFQDVTSKLRAKSFISEKKFGEELFERLIAGISLYRPGPLDEIPNYIKFMLDSDKITYDINGLDSILNNTYSVIVYQEQVSATRSA